MSETPESGPAPQAALVMDEAPARRRLADNQPETFGEKLRDNLYYMRGRGALEIGAIFVLLLIFFAVLQIVGDFPFYSSANLSGTITQAIPVLGLLAIGAGVLMVAGEFDLSVGFVVAFGGIVFIKVANEYPWPLAVLATLLATTFAALLNGVITVYTRIPSFVATLGMGFVWKGASIFVNGQAPAYLTGKTDFLVNLFTGDLGFFRAQLLWLLVVGTVAWFLLHRHRVGNKIFAVGGNPMAAAAVSIKPNVVKLQAFGFLGLMVGLASILIAVRASSMQPTSTENLTLLAIAAAVVGGCSLTGGRGSIVGMIIGAALLRCIENGLLLGKAPGFYVEAFFGVSIVVAAIFNKYMEGKAT